MDSRIAILGHPLHAMLVVFPLGLLFTSFLFDVLFLWRKDPFWRRAAFWVIVVGELGALAAIVPGLLDYLSIPMPLHARQTATAHLVLGLSVAAVYGLQLWLRRTHAGAAAPVQRYPPGLVLLAFISVTALGAQGWLGGQLSHVHGVGVAPERSRPDAPPPGPPAPAGARTEEVSGRDVFRRVCAGCHGTSGEGQIGPRLAGTTYPHDAEEIAKIVRNGRPPLMPAFGKQLSPAEVEAVAAYVESLGERRKRP